MLIVAIVIYQSLAAAMHVKIRIDAKREITFSPYLEVLVEVLALRKR